MMFYVFGKIVIEFLGFLKVLLVYVVISKNK